MTIADGTSVFFNAQSPGFGSAVPLDEKLHRAAMDVVEDPALVETQFFGFNVPDAGIQALTYLWAHPNMRMLSSGPWVWQGTKRDTLACELFDVRDYLPDTLISGDHDLDHFALPNGYQVEVLRPLEKVRIRYEDPQRANSFDVTCTAIMPPAMVASGRHFDQAMRTTGHLQLAGTHHVVDGYHVRDRSWGETRPELPRQSPPFYWTSPVFGDDFAVNVTGIDDPAKQPAWAGVYDLPPEAVAEFNRGWVWRDGDLYGLAEVSIRTDWDRTTGYPTRQVIELTDTAGRDLTLTGTITAACFWHAWANLRASIGLARWECDGRVGWGDCQAFAWTDFIRHLMT